jgi:hypothetical protein
VKNTILVITVFFLLCGLVSVLGCSKPYKGPDVSEAAVTGLWEQGRYAGKTLVLRPGRKCQCFVNDCWSYGKYSIDGNKISTTWEWDVDATVPEHEAFYLEGNKILESSKRPETYYSRVATADEIKDEDYPELERQ